MTDINSKKDIVLLVDSFYQKILKDPTIGHFFTDVVSISFEKHMPTMHSFWESVLLDKTTYKGNPMLKHIQLDRLSQLQESDFDIWIANWNATVDDLFNGSIADLAKQKAALMKDLMWYKIVESRKENFIQ